MTPPLPWRSPTGRINDPQAVLLVDEVWLLGITRLVGDLERIRHRRLSGRHGPVKVATRRS